MIDLKNYSGFALEFNDDSPEARKLKYYCITNDIPLTQYKKKEEIPNNLVPVGSVKYIENILGYHPIPDYYPKWLENKLYRKVWYSDEWILNRKLFVKPLDRHKRFTGFVTKGTYSKKKKPPFVYSEIVTFINEWRYYISYGNNLGGHWYQGNNEFETVPKLDFYIPKEFTGTIDMGITNNGKFALVECHPPYSCGWYGDQSGSEIYFQWLVDGWDLLIKKG